MAYIFKKMFSLLETVLFDKNLLLPTALLLFLVEFFLCGFIISKIPYTEIDWDAYMSQIKGFLSGQRDYSKLRGATGPLVYPAGFLYFFSILYFFTNQGTDIFKAQFIFSFLYLILTCFIFLIYLRAKKIPPLALIYLTFASRRIHSIVLLRLFNDPVAMIFLYMSIYALIEKHHSISAIMLSLAVSIKMNILLFSPAFLYIWLRLLSLKQVAQNIALAALIQIVLGAPFLMTHPLAYISSSFDLSRQFFYIWTVNWRCIPEQIFLHRGFHIFLLSAHIFCIVFFLMKFHSKTKSNLLSTADILFCLFSINFFGICFARSLHYQFYIWYYHSLPLLLWYDGSSSQSKIQSLLKISVLVCIEFSWNIFPSTVFSSLLLHLGHIFILGSIFSPLISSQTSNQQNFKKKI